MANSTLRTLQKQRQPSRRRTLEGSCGHSLRCSSAGPTSPKIASKAWDPKRTPTSTAVSKIRRSRLAGVTKQNTRAQMMRTVRPPIGPEPVDDARQGKLAKSLQHIGQSLPDTKLRHGRPRVRSVRSGLLPDVPVVPQVHRASDTARRSRYIRQRSSTSPPKTWEPGHGTPSSWVDGKKLILLRRLPKPVRTNAEGWADRGWRA